MVNKDEYIKLN